jgi:general secretion pathway protein M
MHKQTHKLNPHSVQHALQQRWTALSNREQNLLRWAAVVLILAGLWWWGLAPALQALREAPAQHARLDAQWQHLTELQTQAQTLQKLPRMTQAAALKALQNSTSEHLGAGAQLNTTGDRSTVTLNAVSPEALSRWLVQVRTQARAVPVEAHLQRTSKEANPKPSGTAAPALWSGSVVLSLPAS